MFDISELDLTWPMELLFYTLVHGQVFRVNHAVNTWLSIQVLTGPNIAELA